jgi:hypothetical protein
MMERFKKLCFVRVQPTHERISPNGLVRSSLCENIVYHVEIVFHATNTYKILGTIAIRSPEPSLCRDLLLDFASCYLCPILSFMAHGNLPVLIGSTRGLRWPTLDVGRWQTQGKVASRYVRKPHSDNVITHPAPTADPVSTKN